jgi:hypothetical protein
MPNEQTDPNPKRPRMRILAPPRLNAKLRQYYELGSTGKVDSEAIESVVEQLNSDPAAGQKIRAYVEKIGMTFFRTDAGWHEEDWPSEPAEILAVGKELAILFRVQVAAILSNTPAESLGLKTGQDADEMLDQMWERLVAAKNIASEK